MTRDLLVGEEDSSTEADDGGNEIIPFERRPVKGQRTLVLDFLARLAIYCVILEDLLREEQLAWRVLVSAMSLYQKPKYSQARNTKLAIPSFHMEEEDAAGADATSA